MDGTGWTNSKVAWDRKGSMDVVMFLFRMLWPLAIRQWYGAKGIQHRAQQLPSAETEHENAQWSQPRPLPISSSKKWLM